MLSDDGICATAPTARGSVSAAATLACVLGLASFVLVSTPLHSLPLLTGHLGSDPAAIAQTRGLEVIGQLGGPSGDSRAVALMVAGGGAE